MGFLQCNGEKLEEAEEFKSVFRRLFCVRIEIDQLCVWYSFVHVVRSED